MNLTNFDDLTNTITLNLAKESEFTPEQIKTLGKKIEKLDKKYFKERIAVYTFFIDLQKWANEVNIRFNGLTLKQINNYCHQNLSIHIKYSSHVEYFLVIDNQMISVPVTLFSKIHNKDEAILKYQGLISEIDTSKKIETAIGAVLDAYEEIEEKMKNKEKGIDGKKIIDTHLEQKGFKSINYLFVINPIKFDELFFKD